MYSKYDKSVLEELNNIQGGDYVCLYKDNKTSKILIGTFSHAGGFGGHAAGGTFYDYKNGKTHKIASRLWINQTAKNYKPNELLKNANLFYNDQEVPFTKDTIKQADSVTGYLINDKQVTVDEYDDFLKRFESIPLVL